MGRSLMHIHVGISGAVAYWPTYFGGCRAIMTLNYENMAVLKREVEIFEFDL